MTILLLLRVFLVMEEAAMPLPPVSLYPRAIFMPTGLVVTVAGQSKTTRTWNPQTGKWTFAGNLSVAEVMEIWYCYHSIIPPQKKGRFVCGGSNTSGENATTVVKF